MYIAGHVLQGLCTSLLLIAAVPPLAIGYPGTQAAHHGDDHEHVHLRSGGARPGDRRAAGAVPRLAAAVLDRRRDLAAGPGAGGADVRRRAACRSRLAARSSRRSRWRPPAARPRSSAPPSCSPTAFLDARDDRAAARRPGDDRRPDRLPVPREAAAVDDPHDADQHDAGRGNRRRAVRGGGVGVGDRAHRSRAGRALRAAPRRACSTCRRSRARRSPRFVLGVRHHASVRSTTSRWPAWCSSRPGSRSSASRCRRAKRPR